MSVNWEVIKPAIERVLNEWGDDVTPQQMEELRLLFDREVSDTQAADVENALRFSSGAADRYVRLLNHFGRKEDEAEAATESAEAVAEKARTIALWDTFAELLLETQPEDSEYIIIKRQ